MGVGDGNGLRQFDWEGESWSLEIQVIVLAKEARKGIETKGAGTLWWLTGLDSITASEKEENIIWLFIFHKNSGMLADLHLTST